MNQNLNTNSSTSQKRDTSEAVFQVLSDYLFDRVNFLNNPGNVTSNGVTSTTIYNVAIRVVDTSEGKTIRPDRASRFRTVFYIFGGAENADAYILSPCFNPTDTSISSGIADLNIFSHYVGVRLLAGEVSLVSKDKSGTKEVPTSTKIKGDTTYKLEIFFNINSASIYIDNNFIGTVAIDNSSIVNNVVTAYPLISPIRSTNGVSVEMDFENYQFIQDV